MAETTPFKGTSTDTNGQFVVVEGTVKRYQPPGIKVVLSPDPRTVPVYSGDTVTFTVTGTVDPEAGPAKLVLEIDGKVVPLDENGKYLWTAP